MKEQICPVFLEQTTKDLAPSFPVTVHDVIELFPIKGLPPVPDTRIEPSDDSMRSLEVWECAYHPTAWGTWQ